MVRARSNRSTARAEQPAEQPQPRQSPTSPTATAQEPAPPPAPTPAPTPAAQAQVPAPAPRQTREVGGVNQRNAFEAYGQQMSQTAIVGTLIKFNKGDWITGDDEDVAETDLNGLVANMDQLMVGWIKWQDNRPVEQIMGPVAEGYQAPRRSELGDTEQAEWETDNEGRPRDPWQFSNYIVLKRPGAEASDENLFTFATSSKGGLSAIGQLCKDYGKEMRVRPDEYPVVRFGSDSYRHETYGRIYKPIFEITGWEPKSDFER